MIITQPIKLDDEDLTAITPTQVETYLEQHGWMRLERHTRWGQIWRPTTSGSDVYRDIVNSERLMAYYGHRTEVLSLSKWKLADYYKRMAELVTSLGLFEGRMANEVLADIKMIDHLEHYDSWCATMRAAGVEIEEDE